MQKLGLALFFGVFLILLSPSNSMADTTGIPASPSIIPQPPPFNLQIAIPSTGGNGPLTSINVCTNKGTQVSCSGISQYIGAVYSWLIVAASILAVVYIMLAGLRWLV